MSPTTPSSGDVELRASSRDAYADRSEDEGDEAVFAEDPFSQNDSEPYVISFNYVV
jgi:chloride channel 3/4/5